MQGAVRLLLEAIYENDFLPLSYGYRPGVGAQQAVKDLTYELQFGRYGHVVEADIKGFFDNLDHELTMRAVRTHTEESWVLLYIERWLKAPIELQDGTQQWPEKGTPQGGVASPLLANLFLHYAFDKWMEREYPGMPFERYADDAVCHCKSEAQAVALKQALQARMTEVGLALHPEKTRIVYCQDDDRREDYPHVAFDFLGYTFRPRRSKNRWGKYFINFSPAISNKAAKGIRQRSRRWCWPLRSDKSLEDLSRMFNPIIQGWINYYGRYYKSARYPTLLQLDRRLVRWATRKYKRLRGHRRRAEHWLHRIAVKQPELFAHWRLLHATAGR